MAQKQSLYFPLKCQTPQQKTRANTEMITTITVNKNTLKSEWKVMIFIKKWISYFHYHSWAWLLLLLPLPPPPLLLHLFNGLFSRTTWVSQHQKGKTSLDLSEARDYGVLRWQWHQLDHMQTICILLQTDNHTNTSSLNFLQAGCSSWCPTNSVKALKACSWVQLSFTNIPQAFTVNHLVFSI